MGKKSLKKSINKYYHYNIDIRNYDLLKSFLKYKNKIKIIIIVSTAIS